MPNRLYPSILQPILDGEFNWSDPFGFAKVALIAAGGYAYHPSHRYLSSVPAAARVGYPLALTGRVAIGPQARSNRLTWYGVSGPQVTAAVLYIDSGLPPAQTPLLAYFDDVDGLPAIPDKRDLALTWPASVVFEL
jgi:hypothetical protein